MIIKSIVVEPVLETLAVWMVDGQKRANVAHSASVALLRRANLLEIPSGAAQWYVVAAV